MYPRNAASPPVYDVGTLIQSSDGTMQTSGASARVKIGSGAWGAAAGSLDCDATSGIWTYVPSQAETNAESFILAVYKTGCLSISRTIVPSASATAGRAVLSSETHTGAVIPRVTLVDTCTTNTDMRGTDNAALAATALSTAVWTSTIAGRIDVAISTRSTFAGGAVASVTGNVGGNVLGSVGSVVAAVELDSATNTKITDINTFATRMTTALIQDGLVWQFTVNALENAPSATGVEDLQATQEEILELIDNYLTGVNAAAQDIPGTIAGFPATLNVGDSYTDDMNNAITITVVDESNNPVDTWGDYDVNHAGFTPSLVISGSGGKVTATVTYDTDHFLVEIPTSESLRASPGTATMQFVLKWYVSGRLVAQKTIVTGQAVTWIKQI